MIQALAFYLFASLVVLSGVMVITAKNPVHSVLWLIVAFFNAAGNRLNQQETEEQKLFHDAKFTEHNGGRQQEKDSDSRCRATVDFAGLIAYQAGVLFQTIRDK